MVDFPTPPFPERTSIIFLTSLSFNAISNKAGSSYFDYPEAQISLFGHSSHDFFFPA